MTDLPDLDLDFVRDQFPALANGWVHMENAGGSYVPRQVIGRMTAFMSEIQAQPSYVSGPSQRSRDCLASAQAGMAALIGAAVGEIIVGPSTTLNVYVLAQALRPLFAPGDELVVTNQDHEANAGAWRRLAEFGLTVREWRVDPRTGDLSPGDLDDLLTARTRLVCFAHCSNVVGSINPVAEIAAKAHAAGAWVCVDGVATAAHLKIDVAALGVDFYLISLYKLYGPHLAVLYGRRDCLLQARNQNHYFFGEDSLPGKLNPGGLSFESVAGLGGITDYLEAVYRHHFGSEDNEPQKRLEQVFALFEAQEERLAGPLADYLSAHPKVRLIGRATGDRGARLPTFSFAVDGRDPADIAALAARRGLALGHGHFYAPRCLEALGLAAEPGVVRASLVHYNTIDEVERLIDTLDAML